MKRSLKISKINGDLAFKGIVADIKQVFQSEAKTLGFIDAKLKQMEKLVTGVLDKRSFEKLKELARFSSEAGKEIVKLSKVEPSLVLDKQTFSMLFFLNYNSRMMLKRAREQKDLVRQQSQEKEDWPNLYDPSEHFSSVPLQDPLDLIED
ncbi:MAG: hypothetical protein ABIH69_03115 [bacterium]